MKFQKNQTSYEKDAFIGQLVQQMEFLGNEK
jgi:hypothetical protein